MLYSVLGSQAFLEGAVASKKNYRKPEPVKKMYREPELVKKMYMEPEPVNKMYRKPKPKKGYIGSQSLFFLVLHNFTNVSSLLMYFSNH